MVENKNSESFGVAEMLRVELAKVEQKDISKKYLDEYLIELSKYDDNIKFDDNGLPIYRWFDFYWNDKGRYPFLFYVDSEIAGISFVRELHENVYEIAEFYVVPKFRGNENALWFAGEIANKFDGEIEFSTRHKNERAIRFWDKFASGFDHVITTDNEWKNWAIRRHAPVTHFLKLQDEYFNKIKSKRKTLEGRLNDEKRKQILIGDFIDFVNVLDENAHILTKVVDKYIFDNFDQMLLFIDKNELGFDNNEEDAEVLKVYRTIYPKEKEDRYGVVIFRVEMMAMQSIASE